MNFVKKDYTFNDLVDIMNMLRGDNGCPWDKEQTHQSIKYCLLEEACEAMEALDQKQPDDFADELGDLLLQIVFHSQMAQEQNHFSVQDVINHICKKLISRHTHIFGEDKTDNAAEVLALWEQNKKAEKGLSSQTEAMRDVCSYLPGLLRAQKVQKKAAQVGFDWDDVGGALEKLSEEIQELKDAAEEKNFSHIEEELGDLLFSCVNVSRFLKVNPEEALKSATDKFINRFEKIELAAKNMNKDLNDMSLAEMDALWDKAKDKQI